MFVEFLAAQPAPCTYIHSAVGPLDFSSSPFSKIRKSRKLPCSSHQELLASRC
jgi:hypothetical protein